jgi:alpha-glucosidase (family GH31 glycosyl hydrolase)
MSCKDGDIINCINSCTDCNKPTMENLATRNENCLQVCGSALKHGYADVKSICQCNPRTKIKPCIMEDDYERKKCFLKNGYQYFDEECAPNRTNVDYGFYDIKRENYAYDGEPELPYVGGGGLQRNYYNYMGCDYTFPYNNDIKLKYKTPFKGEENFSFSKNDGGYIKYDKLTDNIILVSMNPRQGNDEIAKLGILRTPAINPEFQAEKLTRPKKTVEKYCSQTNTLNTLNTLNGQSNNIPSSSPEIPIKSDVNYLNISIKEEKNAETLYSKEDRLLESKLDNKYVSITKNNFTINFDFYKCQYGYIRFVDPDFNNEVHNYSVYGLGPITVDNVNRNFSLDWTSWASRRCNEAFGTQQSFSINGSHWPVMYIKRFNRQTGEQKNCLVYFDHFRKCEWFFDDFQTTGQFKIRTREPEFRFYVVIEDTILNCRKQYMKIVGYPQPPIQKSMGMWVGGFGYKNWEMLEKDIKILREKGFPVDGFIFDLYWYGHAFPKEVYELDETNYADNFCHRKSILSQYNKLGTFNWDEKNFPNHVNYINNEMMGKYNYGLTIIEEPYVSADDTDFSYMFHNDMIARMEENGTWAQPNAVMQDWIGEHAAMVDFTNPETGKHWFETRIVPLITKGTFGWWNDLTEPECYNENAVYVGIGQVDDNGDMKHEFYQAPDVLNFNQMLFTKGVCESYNKKLNKRYNVCVRSGSCGIQRYGAYMWPGDEPSNEQKMNSSSASFLTLSLCGLDFVTSDAGGFENDVEESSIYSVWFANAAATRFNLKPHKWWKEGITTSSPAVWGDIQANLQNTIDRYLLSPYYYSWAMDISQFGERKGEPWATTLFFKYQLSDIQLHTLADYFEYNGEDILLGPSLLFIKINKPPKNVLKDKTVYFPKNTRWYDYRNKKWLDGGLHHNIPRKPNQLPLLIKDNSIIPTRTPNQESVNMRFNDVITSYDVYIYSYFGKEAEEFVLYIDDGISMSKNQLKIRFKYTNGVVYVMIPNLNTFSIPKFNFFLIDNNGMIKLGENNIIKKTYSDVIEKYSKNINRSSSQSSSSKKLLYVFIIVLMTIISYIIGKNTCKNNTSKMQVVLVGLLIGLFISIIFAIKN